MATNCASSDCATHDPNKPQTFTTGERMFQAARFVTEMEYQHLVFEEFARKIQPAVRPFHLYNADINSAIPAEYAHAVYRFGHSMLNDEVVREDRDANNVLTDNSVPLLTAFLNPPLFFNNSVQAGHPVYSAREAAGAIVMGTADQTGNELDEFVAETLRNNLLGQPLDLTTLNISRGRDTGIPPLNVLRRQIFKATNDGQLAPYTDWSDYGQHLKHPASLINFVAAYGQHPSILAETTTAGKRAKARAIVDPLITDTVPLDAAAFMFGTVYPGPDGVAGNDPTTPQDESADDIDWRNTPAGVTTTGVDLVDAWVGGLAEVTDLFGGLLGTTMNYVFEHTLENLQDGDRLYYLARTPGMNLRTQLEGNSFAEMIMRNTDGTNSLKADAFSTADCKFQLAHLKGTAAAFTSFGSVVADDPTTECTEPLVLQRKPDGTIQYKQINTVDPSGINGQSVYNGSDNAATGPDNNPATAADNGANASPENPSGNDRMFGGNDNDTFWGGTGNDVIEGGSGDDVVLGGYGNDIETDQGGADVLKGGPGNDALDGGIGDDIFMGGDGSDFINGGANDNEAFAGPGTDFMIAGQGADAVFGDGGSDWIEGGSGQDLLQGDHGAPFFDDPAEVLPGNEIFVGQVGENDYDAEGGDDLMGQNAAIDRNAGAAGFDWAFHQYDTVGANDDMKINQQLVGLPIVLVVNRDRWQETEADSGDRFRDIIHGDDQERVVGPGGFSGCDVLDPAGVARIAGLNKLLTPPGGTGPAFPSSLADVIDASAMGRCPLTGFGGVASDPRSGTVWAE
ncbi:MAG TPA: peroxidase family protein, partial [Ilumatobacteraceae bacterium]|nr:peroxidase family protein [Ilumatobacteraceae bacterium]